MILKTQLMNILKHDRDDSCLTSSGDVRVPVKIMKHTRCVVA